MDRVLDVSSSYILLKTSCEEKARKVQLLSWGGAGGGGKASNLNSEEAKKFLISMIH